MTIRALTYRPTGHLLCAWAVVTLATSVSAQAGQSPRKVLKAPLVIEDQGSFFIGGVPKVTQHAIPPATPGTPHDTPEQITIGQMYVQFQIPARKYKSRWPVIMVHGSSHTGACMESTPDGREGWYPYFVRRGVPVYVVDQSGRGRSGFDESIIHEARDTRTNGERAASLPTLSRITDNFAWTTFFGTLVPRDSTILTGRLVAHGTPLPTSPESDGSFEAIPRFPLDSVDPDIVSRIGSLGPAPTGPNAAYALEYYKQLVPNAEATLPGSLCPECKPATLSPESTWTPRNLATLVERLGGAAVITHSQSGIMGLHMTRLLRQRGQLTKLKALITIEGSCSLETAGVTLTDLDDVPYLAVKGDYTRASSTCQRTTDAIKARRAAGVGRARAEYLKLDEAGLAGVTHMMMLDKNNLEIADILLAWLATTLGRTLPQN